MEIFVILLAARRGEDAAEVAHVVVLVALQLLQVLLLGHLQLFPGNTVLVGLLRHLLRLYKVLATPANPSLLMQCSSSPASHPFRFYKKCVYSLFVNAVLEPYTSPPSPVA